MPPNDPNQGTLFDPNDPNSVNEDSLQRAIDLTDILRQRMEGVAEVTQRMAGSLADLGLAQQRHTNQTDEVLRSMHTATNLTEEQVQNQKLINQYADEYKQTLAETQDLFDKSRSGFRGLAIEEGIYKRGVYHTRGGSVREEELNDPKVRERVVREVAERATVSDVKGLREFNPTEFVRALRTGDIGRAIGEAFQTAGKQKTLTGLARRAGGSIAGIGGGTNPLTQIIGEALPVVAESFLSPAALGYLGLRGLKRFQQDVSRGAGLGLNQAESVREMEGSRFTAFRQGLNPFDALSRQAANAIASGIQDLGFRGQVREAWQESVGNLVKETGLDASAALAQMKTATQDFGLTAKQFTQTMSDLDETAKSAGLTVSQITERIQPFQEGQRQAGAGQQGAILQTRLARSLVGTFAQGPQAQGLASAIAAAQTAPIPLVTRFAGVSPLLAQTPQGIAAVPRALDTFIERMRQIKNSNPQWAQMRDEDWAVEAARLGIPRSYGIELNAGQLTTLLRQHPRGGFQGAMNRETVREARETAKTEGRRGGLLGALHSVEGIIPFHSIDVRHAVTDAALGFPGAELATQVFVHRDAVENAVRGTPYSQTRGGQQQEVNTLMRQLTASGVSPADRKRIRGQLENAVGTDQFQSTYGRIGEGPQGAKVDINIGLKPGVNKILDNPEIKITSNNYRRGQGGSQGSSGGTP